MQTCKSYKGRCPEKRKHKLFKELGGYQTCRGVTDFNKSIDNKLHKLLRTKMRIIYWLLTHWDLTGQQHEE